MATKKSPKIPNFYECISCDYITYNFKDYKKHVETEKHKNNEILQKTTKKSPKIPKKYECNCGKLYKHHSSLYKHKKKCEISHGKIINNGENKGDMKDLVIKLIDDNKELRKTITEMIPQLGNNNTNNSNNVKQKFNINVFLNEQCKDALSMDEFIEGIEISMKNLLTTRDKGQTEGITNIIIENMNRLSIYERPIHCTDKKRETIYIKNDEWEKDENKTHIHKVLKQVECKQIKNIQLWLDDHPNYMNNPVEQDEFIKLVRETSKSVDENREKIVKNLCGSILIE